MKCFSKWSLTDSGLGGKRVLMPSLPSSVSYSLDHSSPSRCNLCLNPFCTACCGPTPLILWILFSLNRWSVWFVIADSCCGYEVMHLVLFFMFVQSGKSFFSFCVRKKLQVLPEWAGNPIFYLPSSFFSCELENHINLWWGTSSTILLLFPPCCKTSCFSVIRKVGRSCRCCKCLVYFHHCPDVLVFCILK